MTRLLAGALLSLALCPAWGAVAHVADNSGFCTNTTHGTVAGSAMIAANCSATTTETATYTAASTSNVVLFSVICGCASTTNVISLSAASWTFTAIACTGATSCTSGTFGATGDRVASFWAVPGGTGATTITITNGTSLSNGNFTNILAMEFSGVNTTTPIDASKALTGSGTCSTTVTPTQNNDGIAGFCFDTITAKGAAYTKGSDDTQQDWGEWAVLSGGSGAAQTVNFTGSGSFQISAIALAPSGGAPASCANRIALLGAGCN